MNPIVYISYVKADETLAVEIASKLDESDKSIQERQKDLSRRLDIVNKSAARVAKALSLGLINPADIKFLPRS